MPKIMPCFNEYLRAFWEICLSFFMNFYGFKAWIGLIFSKFIIYAIESIYFRCLKQHHARSTLDHTFLICELGVIPSIIASTN